MDETLSIGTSHPRRAWLQTICPGILKLPHPNGLLLGVTTAEYNILFHRARDLADLFKSSPHRLRHGGASADALQDGNEKRTDLDLATRGRWSSLSSVRRYRQPAQYLRELSRLSSHQHALARDAERTLPKRL